MYIRTCTVANVRGRTLMAVALAKLASVTLVVPYAAEQRLASEGAKRLRQSNPPQLNHPSAQGGRSALSMQVAAQLHITRCKIRQPRRALLMSGSVVRLWIPAHHS